ncbi:PREDICTED: protein prenyltransferase alpha subunit repeat-containing protein 1 [Tauraco erythrolophus]|uniref:protein prenyltransferase alpha subunit repeat-containing protein 1 n=1 Tax=Tauraco erythrolophus TaxID=121530 RepID=UPI000523206B|nr:PREDICTED: protein prenyltransferase alpha subunit repeat-containing protein 1 [Tauraco erythrolophus]
MHVQKWDVVQQGWTNLSVSQTKEEVLGCGLWWLSTLKKQAQVREGVRGSVDPEVAATVTKCLCPDLERDASSMVLSSPPKVLLDELSSTKYWVSMHVSDHSGFHYRQFLLKSLIGRTATDSNMLVQNQMVNEQNPSLQKEDESAGAEAACEEERSMDLPHHLEEELELCAELIDTYPGHETLWCHRKRVFYLQHHLSNKLPLLSAVVSSVDSSDETLNNSHHSPATSHVAQAMDVDGLNESSSKQGYTQETKRLKRAPVQDSLAPETEYRFIDKVLSACRDADQARFATAYRKWLVTFLDQ